MAFGRLERPQGSQPMSDINMTPLIDVMLVLLIIFMITAPMMTSKLKLDLPNAETPPPTQPVPVVMNVGLNADGKLYLDDVVITQEALAKRATEQARVKPDTEVQLRADTAVPYGRVVEVMGAAHAAGLQRIGFVTQPTDGAVQGTQK